MLSLLPDAILSCEFRAVVNHFTGLSSGMITEAVFVTATGSRNSSLSVNSVAVCSSLRCCVVVTLFSCIFYL